LRRYRPGDASEILETVNAGVVTILPGWLQRVTADNLKFGELKTVVGVAHVGPHNVSKNVRLSAASRAGTSPAKKLQIEIRFSLVIPLNGQLVTNLLNVGWLQAHWNFKYSLAGIGLSILRAILALDP
jgi:hypothetical protein